MDLSDVKPACVVDGVPWYDFLFEYDWDGRTYGFEICARSEAEAKDRLKRLPLARFLGPGERVAVPDNAPTRWLMPYWLAAVCTWRNVRSRNRVRRGP
jgi:hypothetical protein